ncbi:hypothetical protein PN36_25820 [Candidatus Thiomargarita nelsonii]|uniref:Uncharacterized protein n=1 Tax=Candidatus Thiomargarita nelsonii TaxID=1003181 RepID=A0A0A6P6I3_9GAMM|nr:hypothetical protein PN36_25820 [Candidatus Thiomargarita nelsonii]
MQTFFLVPTLCVGNAVTERSGDHACPDAPRPAPFSNKEAIIISIWSLIMPLTKGGFDTNRLFYKLAIQDTFIWVTGRAFEVRHFELSEVASSAAFLLSLPFCVPIHDRHCDSMFSC